MGRGRGRAPDVGRRHGFCRRSRDPRSARAPPGPRRVRLLRTPRRLVRRLYRMVEKQARLHARKGLADFHDRGRPRRVVRRAQAHDARRKGPAAHAYIQHIL